MKIKQITVENEDGSIEFITEMSADDLQKLLQFGINMSASIGLTAMRRRTEDDEPRELND